MELYLTVTAILYLLLPIALGSAISIISAVVHKSFHLHNEEILKKKLLCYTAIQNPQDEMMWSYIIYLNTGILHSPLLESSTNLMR